MIHLFKKIRQQLIKDNKLQKYLAYAVGEVLLVVIGIVLALQFSNWNQKSNEIKKEIWYLDNIANDMFNQQESLKYLKTYYDDVLHISKDILADYKRTMSFKQVDSLSLKLNQLMIYNTFPNIDNTYKELVSSGQVALIENDSLVLNIIDFYIYNNELEKIFSVNQKELFYGEIYPVLNKYAAIDLLPVLDNEDLVYEDKTITDYLSKILETPKNKLELTNAIKNKILVISDYKVNVDESLKMINNMIIAIDNEIALLE